MKTKVQLELQLDQLKRDYKVKEYDLNNWYPEDYEQFYPECETALDDIYGSYQIAGITFWASEIMKGCDPIAFEVFCCNHLDAILQNNPEFFEEYTELKKDLEELEEQISRIETILDEPEELER